MKTAVSASAVASLSIAGAYWFAKSQPSVAQHSTWVGRPEAAIVGPSTSSTFTVCAGVSCMLS